jgi:hypothetical protein
MADGEIGRKGAKGMPEGNKKKVRPKGSGGGTIYGKRSGDGEHIGEDSPGDDRS